MKFVACRDCTDFDGRFYAEGEAAELSASVRHSAYLVAQAQDSARDTAARSKPVRRRKAERSL